MGERLPQPGEPLTLDHVKILRELHRRALPGLWGPSTVAGTIDAMHEGWPFRVATVDGYNYVGRARLGALEVERIQWDTAELISRLHILAPQLLDAAEANLRAQQETAR